MEYFLKIYLPIFFIAFIVLVFVIPSVRVYRQTGINPFRFITNHDQAHDYLGLSMKGFILLLFVTIILYSFSDSLYAYLSPFQYLETNTLKVIGLIMGHIAILGIMIAQIQMRQSWRIGIDYEHKTQLVTTGVFGISRNPIYFFLLIALSGLFLVIPNAISFAILFAAYLVLQITMRLEEDFLTKQHGSEYLEYKQKVRRLV